ncbi:magnesium and cobalt transport protein CorA [Mycolicibacterium sarraceniae]|uniref:magnesium and cobalt transport protein CorA n=1 Tax=Mycolicibacterium sarraceniae TaxID=1534348 RepID=UPI0013D0296B|nr:magnesium and cobalt transport protein CorA [Mycolicibacterium sarraceniae]
MPSFRPIPPSLLGPSRSAADHPEVDARRIHVPVARAMVDCAIYVDGERLPGKYTHAAALAKVHELRAEGQKAFVWLGLHEPDEHQMASVADTFNLHPIAVEDAVHAHQRPKVERYDDSLFLIVKTVKYVPHESVAQARQIVETGEIMVFVGVDYVVTVRHGDHTGLAGLRHHLEAEHLQLAHGPYAVMHGIAEHVVESYLDVARLMECDIDTIEEEAFSPDLKTDIAQIYMLKREVVEMRRAVFPLTSALQKITSEHKDLMTKEVLRYMRDVLSLQTQAGDQISSYDELLSSLVQAELAKVGLQQNLDMRKISAWVAIAAVPTMIAGIYGMNFEHMPELSWTYGYPAVLALMVTVCGSLYFNFRRNHWL